MRPLCLLVSLLALAVACAQPPPAPVMPPRPDMNNPRLLLPTEIPVVPGREANIYFDNIMLLPIDWQKFFHVDVDCPKGQQQEERWTWTPKADEVGVYPLTIRLFDPEDDLLAEGQTTIHVYPADAGAGRPITCLMIGDSLTHASVYPAEVLALCQGDTNPKLTLVGTHVPNAAAPEVRHEGYGGWTARGHATMWGPEPVNAQGRRARSPFLFEKDGKPVLDFQMYCDQNNGGKGPDFITLLLGCNDNFGARDDTIEASIDDFLKYMDILIAEFHRIRPDTKIGIISLMPPAATQDAFGSNYGCGQTRWQYRKNQHRVMERVVAKYGGREADNIFLVPAYVNLDCVHNYPAVEVPANSRAEGPGSKVIRLNNGVHPAASGYKQMADLMYCWMKGILSR